MPLPVRVGRAHLWRQRVQGLSVVSLVLASVACGEDRVIQSTAKPRSTEDVAQAEAPEAPPPVSRTIDFSKELQTRDPFVSFENDFADEAKKRVRSQREVVLDQYSLDELKLAGLVTRIRPSRAMLIDPTQKGHVVHEGQFIGRPEVVQGGESGADYEINWRVDRIREGDIVLVREDPANPDVPSATRVIPLRPDEVLASR